MSVRKPANTRKLFANIKRRALKRVRAANNPPTLNSPAYVRAQKYLLQQKPVIVRESLRSVVVRNPKLKGKTAEIAIAAAELIKGFGKSPPKL
ncbi:Uncharacterised protein [uncultured archaeon]|nr:Uncharacterised protein [uncultured archaeon]